MLVAVGLALAAGLPSASRRLWPEPRTAPLERCAFRAGECGDQRGDPVRGLWLGVRMDINTCSSDALQVVPGIGAALARRIVEDRERHGAFRSLEDVERVKGIGPALRGRLADYAEVGSK